MSHLVKAWTRPIKGFKNYYIDKEGIVYYKNKPVKRHPRKDMKGYTENRGLRVYLYDESNVRKTRSVLSLMADTWLDKPNDFVKPIPKDKNWANTNLDNIIWTPTIQKQLSKWQQLKNWVKQQLFLN